MAVRRTLARSVAALLLPALLTGCGGDSSIADPPVQSSPTSSSPTDDPSTHETAEHFIRRFSVVERRMENTGGITSYVALTKLCRACLELAQQIKGFYDAGGYVHWDGWTIKRIARYHTGGDSWAYKVFIDSAPTSYRESATAPVKHLEGGPATEIIRLDRTGNAWVVAGRARFGG